MDEALHAQEGDAKMTPRIHWRWGRLDAGSTVVGMRRRGTLGDWWRRSWLWRQGCKVWIPEGEPFGFIGATGARKPTARLDLRACHDLPQRPATGHAHAIFVRCLRKLAEHFASLDGPRCVLSKRNMDLKAPLRHDWGQEFAGRPIDRFDNRSRCL